MHQLLDPETPFGKKVHIGVMFAVLYIGFTGGLPRNKDDFARLGISFLFVVFIYKALIEPVFAAE